MKFHPTDGTQAVAARRAAPAARYSVNGGRSWSTATGLPSDPGRIELAYAPTDPAIVYASVELRNRTPPESRAALCKSTDGGRTYTTIVANVDYLGGQGWYDNVVWVDPTDPDSVIVGGIDLWRGQPVGRGNAFGLVKISRWQSAPNSAHADHHAIVAHPDPRLIQPTQHGAHEPIE